MDAGTNNTDKLAEREHSLIKTAESYTTTLCRYRPIKAEYLSFALQPLVVVWSDSTSSTRSWKSTTNNRIPGRGS